MKKTITFPSLRRCWLPVLLTLFYSLNLRAQVTCNLVCNDHVNASMPADKCERQFVPADFLQNPTGTPCVYKVVLSYPYGTNKLNGDNVDRSQVGYTFIYRVTDSATNNSCWGYVTVEDKAGPQPLCKSAKVSCFQVARLTEIVGEVIDNCGQLGSAAIEKLTWADFGCNDPRGLGWVARNIRTWDEWGNSATCSDTLTIGRDSLSKTKKPDPIELGCRALCKKAGYENTSTYPNNVVSNFDLIQFSSDKNSPYYPSPDLLIKLQARDTFNKGLMKCIDAALKVVPYIRDSVLVLLPDGKCIRVDSCIAMYPAPGGFCKTSLTWTDQIIPTCGTGFKIRREWLINDWCALKDTTYVQYIKVDDKEAPIIKATSKLYYEVNTGPHDCFANVAIKALDIDDCDPNIKQNYIVTYDLGGHGGQVSVLSGTLPATINLPAIVATTENLKKHYIKVSVADACLNRTETTIHVKVNDITPPNPVCDENTVTTVDPTTCWARVYAIDLDNGSRDNCCNILHFAVATMADIDKARKEWSSYWESTCKADYWNHKTENLADDKGFFYDGFLEQWINCFVFKDYIDLKDCGPNQVVLRVYEACGVPRYDTHVFPCTEHDWFTYNTYDICRAWHNYTFFHTSGTDKCEDVLPKQCRSDYWNWYDKVNHSTSLVNKIGAGNDILAPFYAGAITLYSFENNHCKFYFPATNIGRNTSAPVAPGNTCSARLYNDCMVNVNVNDKTPPVCQDPADKYAFCDGVISNSYWVNEYAGGRWGVCTDANYATDNFTDKTCVDQNNAPYNQVECEVENNTTDDIADATGKLFGWYGCRIYGTAPHSANDHGPVIDPCSNKDSWSPIYCHTWLCLDRKDQLGKFDASTLFDTPVARQGNPGSTTAGDGKFFIWDNCAAPTITVVDDKKLDNCGNGWLLRTWTASDKCSNKIICDQKILVKHRSDFEVEFPQDLRIVCGDNNNDPSKTGRPVVMDDECELVGVNYEDVRYDIVPDACYKIVRTWTLIDWCKYDPNQHTRDAEVIVDDRKVADVENRYCVYRHLKDEGDGFITYIQIIKVIDTIPPTLVKCKDDTLCITGGYNGFGAEPSGNNCSVPAYKSADFKATDNCSAANQITFRWELDLDDNGTIDRRSGPSVKNFESSELTPGKHKLYVIALDNCGQSDTDFCFITVRDCKKPTPYCYNGIATVLMPTSKEITVWATDLNAGSYDNCTKKADLKYSFDKAGLEASHVYTCADIQGGVSATVPVTIYVWDAAGNNDFCSTYLLIQDGNGNVCPDQAGSVASVAGQVTNEFKESVEKVAMNVKGNLTMAPYTTDINGAYAFKGLPIKQNYSIVPQRNDDPMNGVSTIDLVLIQKHILGVENLKSVYKLIAADVDHNNDITVLDLVELRKLILAVYDKFPNNTSWRFVPKSYDFSNIAAPLKSAFPEQLDITALSQDELNKDFIGIKVGDVNASSAPHSLLGAEAREAGGTLKFRTLDRDMKAGEEASIEISADNFNKIEGYQFSASINGLIITDIRPGALKVSGNNFGLTKLNQGYITTSWSDISKSGVSTSIQKGETLFTLKVKASRDLKLSESLRFNSKFTRAEAYTADETNNTKLLNVALEFSNTNNVRGAYALYQNTPNPFKSQTVIGFELPKGERVTMNVTDVTGKTLKSYTMEGVKGVNNLVINRSDLSGAGVLYYTLQSKSFTDTKKMLLID